MFYDVATLLPGCTLMQRTILRMSGRLGLAICV